VRATASQVEQHCDGFSFTLQFYTHFLKQMEKVREFLWEKNT